MMDTAGPAPISLSRALSGTRGSRTGRGGAGDRGGDDGDEAGDAALPLYEGSKGGPEALLGR